METRPTGEPSPAALVAWLLPAPLLLQAGMNLCLAPLHQNWRIGWVLLLVALVQGLCLRARAVVAVLLWLAVECASLVYANVVVMDIPAPDFSGESRFNEGMVWMSFALVGVLGGGLLALLVGLLRRLWPSRGEPLLEADAIEADAGEPDTDRQRNER